MSGAFQHEAVLYAGEDGFEAATVPFLREGLELGESALVMVSPARIEALRDRLGPDAARIAFADMTDVGDNPARIIPAWRSFVDAQLAAGRSSRVRGIGEPVWWQRSAAELVECQVHESLLTLAITPTTPMTLICPYDVSTLDPAVVAMVDRTHPVVRAARDAQDSGVYDSGDPLAWLPALPLAESGQPAVELRFDVGSLASVRRAVSRCAAAAGLRTARVADLVLAVNEVATNSVVHGGGRGLLRLWHDADGVRCEVADAGRLNRPKAGRERPENAASWERGLWLANQLCDLVQMRSTDAGTLVRLHMRRTDPAAAADEASVPAPPRRFGQG